MQVSYPNKNSTQRYVPRYLFFRTVSYLNEACRPKFIIVLGSPFYKNQELHYFLLRCNNGKQQMFSPRRPTQPSNFVKSSQLSLSIKLDVLFCVY